MKAFSTMVLSVINALIVLTVTLALINGIDCQMPTIAAGTPQISLLENVTDTLFTVSSILPKLAYSLQKQEDLQILTNILLENNTDQMMTLLQHQQDQYNQTICLLQAHQDAVAQAQNQIVGFLQNQQYYENQTSNLLKESQNTAKIAEQSFSDAAIARTEMVSLLQSQQESDYQTKTILQNQQNATDRIETTLTKIASTQTDSMATQTQMADALTLIANTQSQMANTQSQIANTQSQMNIQQTQMVDNLDQLTSLLQIQGQQLGNISASLITMVVKFSKQNDILRRQSDCSHVTHTSGLHIIYPEDDLGFFEVHCDMETDGGGWTVFQRRFDGSVDFFLGWEDYKRGFGSILGEHWLGLQQVHRLTSSGQWTLRIDLEDFNGNTGYAQYEHFQIGDAISFYPLSIGAYSGTAGTDALAYHNGASFSTKDSDHDTCTSGCRQSYDSSCALESQGAWWYYHCYDSNLNGLYQGSTFPEPNGIPGSLMNWYSFSGSGFTPIKKSEMKIRRVE